MTIKSGPSRIAAQAEAIIKRVGLLCNPYFQHLVDGTMSLETFRKTQEQFFFAVTYFPRPMAALVGRLPHPKQRLEILRNLVEEHGDFAESRFHHNTFQQFLSTIGSGPQAIEGLRICPAVHAFNSVLSAVCALDELEVGVGCMGIIEYAFADISALIGKAVTERGWVATRELVHYKLHAEIDVRHAEEFFAVIEESWGDAARRPFIEQGLELGAYAFDRLYRDLYAGALSEKRTDLPRSDESNSMNGKIGG